MHFPVSYFVFVWASVCEDTGTLLMDTQVKLAYVYGGEKLVFEKDEIQQIKCIDKQGKASILSRSLGAVLLHLRSDRVLAEMLGLSCLPEVQWMSPSENLR